MASAPLHIWIWTHFSLERCSCFKYEVCYCIQSAKMRLAPQNKEAQAQEPKRKNNPGNKACRFTAYLFSKLLVQTKGQSYESYAVWPSMLNFLVSEDTEQRDFPLLQCFGDSQHTKEREFSLLQSLGVFTNRQDAKQHNVLQPT